MELELEWSSTFLMVELELEWSFAKAAGVGVELNAIWPELPISARTISARFLPLPHETRIRAIRVREILNWNVITIFQ
jgi:hypothetical protein